MTSTRTPIDTHAHVFSRDLPMDAERRYTPADDASVDRFLDVLDRHGIASAVLVQPSFLGSDNRFMLSAAQQHPERFRAVVVLDWQRPSIADLERPEVCGVRLNLIGSSSIPDLDSPAWLQVARTLAARRAHLEIHGTEEHWRQLADTINRWPAPVVIDHLGRPAPDDEGHVVRLARQDHVWVKLSGPYRTSTELASTRAQEILDATGGARLVFGSDWPFTQHEGSQQYEDQLDWARAVVGAEFFADELRENANRLLGGTCVAAT